MNSFAKLIETHIISFKEVLVLNYKKIGLNELEAMIIILLYEQKKHNNNALSVSLLAKYVTIDQKQLSEIIVNLVEKGYIELLLEQGQECFSLKPTIEKLGLALDQTESIDYKEELKLIIGDLENHYQRHLNANELLIIRRWMSEEYSIDLIKAAVEESYKQNRLNVRFVDTILTNRANRVKCDEVNPEIEEVLNQIHVNKKN